MRGWQKVKQLWASKTLFALSVSCVPILSSKLSSGNFSRLIILGLEKFRHEIVAKQHTVISVKMVPWIKKMQKTEPP